MLNNMKITCRNLAIAITLLQKFLRENKKMKKKIVRKTSVAILIYLCRSTSSLNK